MLPHQETTGNSIMEYLRLAANLMLYASYSGGPLTTSDNLNACHHSTAGDRSHTRCLNAMRESIRHMLSSHTQVNTAGDRSRHDIANLLTSYWKSRGIHPQAPIHANASTCVECISFRTVQASSKRERQNS